MKIPERQVPSADAGASGLNPTAMDGRQERVNLTCAAADMK
ncbi:MAG: hypothetical protein ACM3SW_08975 [Actinomycetota bacterium]